MNLIALWIAEWLVDNENAGMVVWHLVHCPLLMLLRFRDSEHYGGMPDQTGKV